MKRDTTILAIAALVLVACAYTLPQAAWAQSLGDRLKGRVRLPAKSDVERKVESKVDQVARKVVRCATGDDNCIQAAKKSGAEVETYEPASTEPASAATASAVTASVATAAAPAQPDDIKPVPSGPAVPLAQMEANCDTSAVGRTAAAHRDEAYNPGPAGAATVLAKIKPIFAGFAPNGFETRTGGTVFTPDYGMPANMHPWNFHVLGYPYGCLSNGKFTKDEHYAFSAYITINNGLHYGAYRLPTDFNPNSPNGDGAGEDSRFGFYWLLDEWLTNGLPQAKDGYFHIRDAYEDTYWFTRGGQLPFEYVSREEFLRKQIGIVQTTLAYERSELEQNYAAAGQRLDDATVASMFGAMYQKPLVRYQQLLKQPTAWLQQQAIVRINPEGQDSGYEFLDASQVGPDVRVPVKPAPTYLDKSKAAGEPQYLVIRLGNEFKRGEYYQLRDLVEQNVDTFKALVN